MCERVTNLPNKPVAIELGIEIDEPEKVADRRKHALTNVISRS
jgi:hypothetical protein